MTEEIHAGRSGNRTAVAMTCPRCGETVGWILTDGVAKECRCPKCAALVATFDGDDFVMPGDAPGAT